MEKDQEAKKAIKKHKSKEVNPCFGISQLGCGNVQGC
jgi:hypothetical protein